MLKKNQKRWLPTKIPISMCHLAIYKKRNNETLIRFVKKKFKIKMHQNPQLIKNISTPSLPKFHVLKPDSKTRPEKKEN